jgi:hypothetical protein
VGLRRGTQMGGDSLPGREPSRAERLPLERQRPNVKLKLLRLATLAAVTVLAAVAAATVGLRRRHRALSGTSM